MQLINNKKHRGPKLDTCGTSEILKNILEMWLSELMKGYFLAKYNNFMKRQLINFILTCTIESFIKICKYQRNLRVMSFLRCQLILYFEVLPMTFYSLLLIFK